MVGRTEAEMGGGAYEGGGYGVYGYVSGAHGTWTLYRVN